MTRGWVACVASMACMASGGWASAQQPVGPGPTDPAVGPAESTAVQPGPSAEPTPIAQPGSEASPPAPTAPPPAPAAQPQPAAPAAQPAPGAQPAAPAAQPAAPAAQPAAQPPPYPPPAPEADSEPPAEPLEVGQRSFGLALNLGPYSGFGPGLRAGHQRFGVEASWGYVPILVGYTDADANAQFELFNSTQFNANLYAIFAQIKRFGIGMTAGYKRNSLLGNGGGGGGYMTFDFTRTLAMHAAVGISVFPNGEDAIVDELPNPCEGRDYCSYEYQFDIPGPTVQVGIMAGIVWYPG